MKREHKKKSEESESRKELAGLELQVPGHVMLTNSPSSPTCPALDKEY